MNLKDRYIGITGFAEPGDLRTARLCATFMPDRVRLMAGVLVSAKTLRGETSLRRRYFDPSCGNLARYLGALGHSGAWPVVHFNTRARGRALHEELCKLLDVVPFLSGVQLNAEHPDPAPLVCLKEQHPYVELIVQLPPRCVGARPSVDSVLDYARGYAEIADHFLLDLSCGNGLPLDAAFARELVAAWRLPARLGVAGGLDHESVKGLRGLSVSCDSESRLRTPEDALDSGAALAYVLAAKNTLAP